MTTIDLIKMEANSSPANFLARSKKLPPPPLCLPATNTTLDEEKILNSNTKHEQKKSTKNCCLSSSTEDCPHKSISYILPFSQRSQILEMLTNSSSALLVPPPLETKQKRTSNVTYTNPLNLLRQRQSSIKTPIVDSEWIDFIRLIIHQPLEKELKSLLDNYKNNYFDRVNAPNTSDETIRATLCAMVSEALTTYGSSSILPRKISDDLTTVAVSPSSATNNTINSNANAKRKRKDMNSSLSPSPSASVGINSQTKFVISHIIPGKFESQSNGQKTTSQQHLKQFQKKYASLFKYIPNKDEKEYLVRERLGKNMSVGSSRVFNNNNICLMLYDEAVNYIDEYDLELSCISLDDAFTLPEPILARINSSI